MGLSKTIVPINFFSTNYKHTINAESIKCLLLDREKSFGLIFFSSARHDQWPFGRKWCPFIDIFFTYRALVDFRMHSSNAYLLHSKSLGQSSALFSLIKA